MKAGFANLRIVFALPLSAVFCFAVTAPLLAQLRADGVALKVPDIIEVESGIERLMPIEIAPQGSAPDQAMLLVRGVPSSVALTTGRLFASGVWAIKPSAAPDVRIVTAPYTIDESQITVTLVTFDGDILSEASSRLVIAPRADASETSSIEAAESESRLAALNATPPDQTNTSVSGGTSPEENNGPPQSSLSQKDREKVFILMQRGDQNFREGKINAARLFYRRAAEMGWPDGALAVGKTYDPNQLAQFTILGGIEPNPELARQWYEKARDLGSQIAISQLQRLGQR